MMDIVERLRNLPYRPMVNYGNGDVRDELDPDIAEAADEIERLERAYNQLRETYLQAYETYRQAADEIERLRLGRETMGNLWAREKEARHAAEAEIERLRSQLVAFAGIMHRFKEPNETDN